MTETAPRKRLKQRTAAKPEGYMVNGGADCIEIAATLEVDGITISAGDLVRIDGKKGRFQFAHVEPAEIPSAAIVKVFEMQGSAPRMARFFHVSQIVALKVPKPRRKKAAV
jgi:hypothetical protein